jgi:hypothetical protein
MDSPVEMRSRAKQANDFKRVEFKMAEVTQLIESLVSTACGSGRVKQR